MALEGIKLTKRNVAVPVSPTTIGTTAVKFTPIAENNKTVFVATLGTTDGAKLKLKKGANPRFGAADDLEVIEVINKSGATDNDGTTVVFSVDTAKYLQADGTLEFVATAASTCTLFAVSAF